MSNRDRDDTTTDRVRTGRRSEHTPNPEERGKWLSAILALLGLWMIGQAIALDVTVGQFWNDVAAGVLLTVLGAYNYSRQADERLANTAVATIAALVGLWLVVSPFVLGADAGLTEALIEAAFWNDVVVGALAFLIGAYTAYRDRDSRREVRRTTTEP